MNALRIKRREKDMATLRLGHATLSCESTDGTKEAAPGIKPGASLVKRRCGFTLLEALMAGVLLGIAAVTLCGVSVRCQARSQLNRQYESAWQHLDRQLANVSMTGIDELLREGMAEGQASGAGTTFYWKMILTPVDGRLYRVRMTVEWTDRNERHSIEAETLLNSESGADIYAQTASI
jgi:Tfp pilus assembly protein PilV